MTYPLGNRYVANMDVVDPNPYTPKRFAVIGAVEQAPIGNTILRIGENVPRERTWQQVAHLVLTPNEREILIASLVAQRQAGQDAPIESPWPLAEGDRVRLMVDAEVYARPDPEDEPGEDWWTLAVTAAGERVLLDGMLPGEVAERVRKAPTKSTGMRACA
jgi:hypothetical protein